MRIKLRPPYTDYTFFREKRGLDSVEYAIDLSILAYSDVDFILKLFGIKDAQRGPELTMYQWVVGDNTTSTCNMPNPLEMYILNKANTQVLILVYEDVTLVVFRGTLGIKNWESDLDAFMTHDGFHRGFWDIWTQVSEFVKDHTFAKEVVLTGHSLGGAMAAIAATQLKDTCVIKHLVTFGQPRFGNHNATNMIDHGAIQKYSRYINGDDIVPTVPLRHFGFIGVGDVIELPTTKHNWWDISTEFPYIFTEEVFNHIPTLCYAEYIWKGAK